jgi:hypothetical protein
MDGGSYAEQRRYTDTRDLYVEAQDIYTAFPNEVSKNQKKIDEAVKNTIIAEEHLRRLCGF